MHAHRWRREQWKIFAALCVDVSPPGQKRKLTFNHHCLYSCKARYTPATKLTVAETADKSATKSTVSDTVDFVASFGDKSATTWIQQLVVVDTVANSVDFVADTVSLSPVCMGPKRLGRLSTKSTASNSTLSPVCTGAYHYCSRCHIMHGCYWQLINRRWFDWTGKSH